MNQNKLALAALLVGLVALAFGVFGGGKTTEIIRETVRELVGNAGTENLNPVTFYDNVTRHYGFLSTTTPQTLTGHTLGGSDFINPGALRVVTLGGAFDADYTYTLPASSSVPHLVPNPGDRSEICYYVTATTSKSGLILTPGTGWDLTIATTSAIGVSTTTVATVRTIEQNQIGCLDLFREPGGALTQPGNINAEIRVRVNADATGND